MTQRTDRDLGSTQPIGSVRRDNDPTEDKETNLAELRRLLEQHGERQHYNLEMPEDVKAMWEFVNKCEEEKANKKRGES